jgi:hypothetical protein
MANMRNVRGLRESVEALKRIGKNLEMRGLAVALRAGLEVYLPEVLARAPQREGAYKDALEIRPPRKRRGTILAGIGLNKDRLYTSTGGRRPSNLPALLEFGHAIRYRNTDDQLVDGGTVPALPHFRPTLESHTDDAIAAVADALERFLMAVAESHAIRENNLRKSLARAEARVSWNRSQAKKWAGAGDRTKVAKYLARAYAAETKRLRYSRKLGSR